MNSVQRNRVWYRTAKSGLRKPLIWLRHWGLDENDAFIASYPRSGNTWLRFLMFEVLTSGSADFTEVNRVVAEVGLQGPARPVLPGEGRLIKTHEPYYPQYKKAVYLVRDVRDVVLSEFDFQTAMGWIGYDFDTFLRRFLRGEVNPFSAWHQHVAGWVDSPLASTSEFLLIKFEDLRQHTGRVLTQVLDFLGVQVDPQTIGDAIANNTTQRMQEKERRTPQYKPEAPKPDADEASRFIRSGSVGRWRNRLTGAQLELIEQHAGHVLSRMGYPSVKAEPAAESSSLVTHSSQ